MRTFSRELSDVLVLEENAYKKIVILIYLDIVYSNLLITYTVFIYFILYLFRK